MTPQRNAILAIRKREETLLNSISDTTEFKREMRQGMMSTIAIIDEILAIEGI